MGRSLRRIKKSRPKIIRRKHKKPFLKSSKPVEINASKGVIEENLNREIDWDERKKVDDNYEELGLILDPNVGFGRKSDKRDAIIEAAGDIVNEENDVDVYVNDELKAALAKQRSTGKALPKKPTPHQRQVVARLVDAYGDDIDSMVRDRKLNSMQHSHGQLRKLIESCRYWKAGTHVDFRGKVKGL